MDFERLKIYTVERDETKLTHTLVPLTKSSYITFFVVHAIIMSMAVFLTVCGFKGIGGADTGIAVMGIIWIVLTAIQTPLLLIEIKKIRKHFRFELNENGVILRNLKSEYLIRWSDVEMFGLVNHTYKPMLVRPRHYFKYDSCMYFTIENKDENFVRKQCLRPNYSALDHSKVTDTTIVLSLPLRDAREEYRAFCEYIYKYCDKQKEKCFIEVFE